MNCIVRYSHVLLLCCFILIEFKAWNQSESNFEFRPYGAIAIYSIDNCDCPLLPNSKVPSNFSWGPEAGAAISLFRYVRITPGLSLFRNTSLRTGSNLYALPSALYNETTLKSRNTLASISIGPNIGLGKIKFVPFVGYNYHRQTVYDSHKTVTIYHIDPAPATHYPDVPYSRKDEINSADKSINNTSALFVGLEGDFEISSKSSIFISLTKVYSPSDGLWAGDTDETKISIIRIGAIFSLKGD